VLNGAGHVSAIQKLDRTCSTSSGCATVWKPVGVGDVNGDGHADLMWFNASTGGVSAWVLNGAGHVSAIQKLDRTCSTSSGCATVWKPVGIGSV
jgi:hypothetical protein